MFSVTALPANRGDCLIVRWGERHSPHVMVIDGGTKAVGDLVRAQLAGIEKIDLLVVSHIDTDHISGILGLLESGNLGIPVSEVWFNSRRHLVSSAAGDIADLSADEGDRLTHAIERRGYAWNAAFGGKAVATQPDRAPVIALAGGMKLTLLSPPPSALRELLPTWPAAITEFEREFEERDPIDFAGPPDCLDGSTLPDIVQLAAKEFEPDLSAKNGSSIGFLLDFEGKRALLTGDAHADKLLAGIDQISPTGKLEVDLFKLSHHGSRGTTNRALIDKVWAKNYLISTSGAVYGHPHGDPIARILVSDVPEPHLVFNYRSRCNEVWDTPSLKQKHHYSTTYPDSGESGITIVLAP